jgi:hypothetical protein
VVAKKITGRVGQKINISPKVSDVDGNNVSVKFWQYKEVGSVKDDVVISQKGNTADIAIPQTAQKGDVVHIIVEAQDNGVPVLTRYQRVVVTIN